MRIGTAWLGIVVGLCACGKAFDAGSADAGGGAGGDTTLGGAAGASSGGSGGHTGGSGAQAGTGVGGSSIAGGAAGGGSGGVGGRAGSGGQGGVISVGGLGGVAGSPEIPPIPSVGLSLWLRADHGVVQKDGQVQQWLDQSGQHMDALGTANNVEPKFVSNGLNGLPTLDFDGVDDFLSLPDGFADFSQGLSIFIVMNALDGACASIFESSNGSEIQDIALGFYQNIWQYEVANQDVTGGTIDPATAVPGVLASVQRATGAVELRLSGNILNQGQFMAPDVALRKENFVGHTLYASCGYFKGQLSELIVYDRAVSDKEVLAIEDYLETHWSIQTKP
jgi:hypothetical protein